MVGELCGPTSLLVSDLQKNADDKSLLEVVIRPLERQAKLLHLMTRLCHVLTELIEGRRILNDVRTGRATGKYSDYPTNK